MKIKYFLNLKKSKGFRIRMNLMVDMVFLVLCKQLQEDIEPVQINSILQRTSALNKFLVELKEIYVKLIGEANYQVPYENDLSFKVFMSSIGHARIIGQFREDSVLNNILEFDIATDQNYLVDVIKSLENFLKKYE